jgi:uncharacterized RDD family membrane protein YckC
MTVDAAAVPRQPVSQRRLERWRVEGTYAGGGSRLIGYIIDTVIITTSFALGASVLEYVVSTVFPVELDLNDTAPWIAAVALFVWSFVYFAYSLAVTGRTIGKAIVGTKVYRADGADLGAGRAVVRVLAMSLSFALLLIGFMFILLRKDRRALHDLIAGTCEVYWWRRRT